MARIEADAGGKESIARPRFLAGATDIVLAARPRHGERVALPDGPCRQRHRRSTLRHRLAGGDGDGLVGREVSGTLVQEPVAAGRRRAEGEPVHHRMRLRRQGPCRAHLFRRDTADGALRRKRLELAKRLRQRRNGGRKLPPGRQRHRDQPKRLTISASAGFGRGAGAPSAFRSR